jgi:ABC-type amino acid transport substrate-binding protein
MKQRYITIILLLLAAVVQTAAQALTDRYNRQNPVVMVCHWDNPPYEFLNDNGEPAGINVDIVKAVMHELDLPCQFIMKEWSVAKNTFDNGNADLILTDARSYQKATFFSSENVLQYHRILADSVAEIRFIGRDRQLIEQVDDQYSRLKQKGGLAIIQDRWMHPERVQPESTPIEPYIAGGILLVAAIVGLFIWLARRHVKRVTRRITELNEMMYKALHMGNYDVMVYDIANDRVTNQYGNILPKEGMTLEEYIRHIHPDQREEFIRKSKSLNEGRERHFVLNKRWNKGTEQQPNYLHFQEHAILEVDDSGRPAYVINAVNDVTQDVKIYQAARDISHRYEAILSDPFVAMSFYDNKGALIDHNEAMNNLLHGIDSSLFKEIFKPEEHKDLSVTRHLYYPEYGIDKYVECHIQPLYNAKGEIANYLMTTNGRAAAI